MDTQTTLTVTVFKDQIHFTWFNENPEGDTKILHTSCGFEANCNGAEGYIRDNELDTYSTYYEENEFGDPIKLYFAN